LAGERTFQDHLAQESAGLLGLYGAAVHGLGHLLLGDDVRPPAELERRATAPEVPLADLGGRVPVLLSVDGEAHLSLRGRSATIAPAPRRSPTAT
jgi:hypothetical protein